MSHPILVVQGAQWGSEAKGNIAAKLCVDRNIDFAVRTGAINAGHSVVYKGRKFAMQQLPTGWVNPHTKLVIGAGAYIHPATLFREIDEINAAMPGDDVRNRLCIDSRCGIHDEAAEDASKAANRHHRIGATGKGCSEAIVAKIRDRNNGYKLFKDTEYGRSAGLHYTDTVHLLNRAYDVNESILVEGTQGTLLDLHLGPYPFTTSRMTTAANWVAECGLSPALDYEVVLVIRTYPIRVAGNSGPMDNEIEWVDLARTINTKLSVLGHPPLVADSALVEFQNSMELAAKGSYNVPIAGKPARFSLRLSEWTPGIRGEYREAASELHRDALNLCTPATVTELRKLFEMTTVTKKLRRIAEINMSDLRHSIAVNRPAWAALTFLDYVEPELANTVISQPRDYVVGQSASRAGLYISHLAAKLGIPINMVSVGPELEHVWSPSHLGIGNWGK